MPPTPTVPPRADLLATPVRRPHGDRDAGVDAAVDRAGCRFEVMWTFVTLPELLGV